MATAIVSKKNFLCMSYMPLFFGCQVAKKMRHPKDNSATDEPKKKFFFLKINLKLMQQEA
jgi:hypothetical protein